MKKLICLISMVAVSLWIVGIATAGEYHYTNSLICSDCHTMHATMQHDYAGGGSPVSWTPSDHLLKGTTTAALCLTCHDNVSTIPDVSGADTNSTPSGGRSAGALTTATNPYEDWKGHTLSTSSVTPPGGSAMDGGLNCSGCHSVHGSTNFRNLGGLWSGTTLDYEISTTAGNTKAVRIDIASLPALGSRVSGGYYSASNIFLNEVSSSDSPYGDLCGQCHGNFHSTANTNASSPFIRHPTEAVNFPSGYATQYNAKTNKVPVMMASNSSSVTYDTTTSPSCMSCHKAHGNKNPFGLIYMASSGTVTEQGVDTGVLRDLCGQCHTYGN